MKHELCYLCFRRALQNSPLWNLTLNELRGDTSNRETWWVHTVKQRFICSFFHQLLQLHLQKWGATNAHQHPRPVVSRSTAGSRLPLLMSFFSQTGSNAGDHSLPGDLPDWPGDDGYCHEGLHRGETLHILTCFLCLASFFNVIFPLFSGWSDQLWEEKKGKGKQLCEDYVRTHFGEIKSFLTCLLWCVPKGVWGDCSDQTAPAGLQ